MLRLRYIVCAAVVGFASVGDAVSVAPACEPCGACHGGHAYFNSAPPRGVHYRWVPVYEDGRMHLVQRAYRDQATVRSTPTAPGSSYGAYGSPMPPTTALEGITSKYRSYSAPGSSNPVPPGPSGTGPGSSNPVPPAPAASSPASPGAVPPGAAASASATSDRLSLANRALTLLRAKCARCHGETRQQSGLDLSSRESILRGGASGPAVVPGQPDESLVLRRVRDGEMPPRNAGRLSPQQIGTLQQWIASGAPSAQER
jgi:mono/diheme cytochrome c family protein